MEEVDALGGLSLNLFLAMAMMNLKLWQLAALALPMIVILLVQTVVYVPVCKLPLAVFNIMGRDYEAAAMTTAFCGFAKGRNPNAMANMRALVERSGSVEILHRTVRKLIRELLTPWY